jgi:hypothetical protein
LGHAVWYKFTDVSEVLAASIIRAMMAAASTSETSVNFYQTTWRNNLEDNQLHLRMVRLWSVQINLINHIKLNLSHWKTGKGVGK